MKFYIASKLENAPAVRSLRDRLLTLGWSVTYDWTVHGSVQREGADVIQIVALAEAAGVEAADVVIVLLPGGRGTHTELGMAIALKKKIVLCGLLERDFGDDGNTVAFYHHPQVQFFHHNPDYNPRPSFALDALVHVLEHLTGIEGEGWAEEAASKEVK
jgi:hypothetical protein